MVGSRLHQRRMRTERFLSANWVANQDLFCYFFFLCFVAPEDVQLFMSDVKDKMSTRSRGKTIADIVQAIEEIFTEFEELQRKSSCPSRKDTVQSLCNWSANLSPTFSDIKGNITSNSLKELALASSHSFQSIKERPKGHQLQMAGNSLYWPTPQPKHHVFSPLGVGNSWKPSGFNSMPPSSGQNDACINLKPMV